MVAAPSRPRVSISGALERCASEPICKRLRRSSPAAFSERKIGFHFFEDASIMATIVLQTVGSAVGGMIAGPLGAMVGRALGGLAGAAIDNALLGGENTKYVEGPRLKEIDGLTSTEGAAIPRVYGRARVGGQLIWATRLEEAANTNVERSGSQGGKGMSGPKTVTTTYSYFANLAIGLCEGSIAFVRRVWADGKELDLARVTMRVHRGSQMQ